MNWLNLHILGTTDNNGHMAYQLIYVSIHTAFFLCYTLTTPALSIKASRKILCYNIPKVSEWNGYSAPVRVGCKFCCRCWIRNYKHLTSLQLQALTIWPRNLHLNTNLLKSTRPQWVSVFVGQGPGLSGKFSVCTQNLASRTLRTEPSTALAYISNMATSNVLKLCGH